MKVRGTWFLFVMIRFRSASRWYPVNVEKYGSTTILVGFAMTQRLLVDDMIDGVDLSELCGSSSSPPQLSMELWISLDCNYSVTCLEDDSLLS
jgi:hypothetical protein